ncbi:MAG TPA: cupin domain-containing protein [Terracidiphilus sp.]|nr:cupin domain-containing protein [Terracidiphilus sp.]
MRIQTSKDRPSRKGRPEWFTGNVWIDEIAVGAEPSRLRAFRVSFSTGARTAWHTHPVGQGLHVLTGTGLAQSEGQPVREIHPGDTVSFAPNDRHWHGAGPGTTMVHLAPQEADAQGVGVVWLEPVTDQEYASR